MATHATRERLFLADLLEDTGPDAPTLCAGWTTRDLAAHLVVREHRADAAGGILVRPLAGRLERVQREFTEKPYEELVRMIRNGPSRWSPYRIKQVDEGANTVEFFVHAEDVRRVGELWKPRELTAEYADALWRRLETAARVMARKSPVGLVFRRPDGQTVVGRKGTPVVTVTGDPGELLLFASGRQSVAKVHTEGEEPAVEQVSRAPLGIA